MAEARCSDPDSVNALQALESKAVQAPTGAMVDQLDELLLVESWFRGRNGADALVADTVVGALEKLAAHVRTAVELATENCHDALRTPPTIA
jgi:excinuclease ABC subunit C